MLKEIVWPGVGASFHNGVIENFAELVDTDLSAATRTYFSVNPR
jgi:hypothetical protein